MNCCWQGRALYDQGLPPSALGRNQELDPIQEPSWGWSGSHPSLFAYKLKHPTMSAHRQMLCSDKIWVTRTGAQHRDMQTWGTRVRDHYPVCNLLIGEDLQGRRCQDICLALKIRRRLHAHPIKHSLHECVQLHFALRPGSSSSAHPVSAGEHLHQRAAASSFISPATSCHAEVTWCQQNEHTYGSIWPWLIAACLPPSDLLGQVGLSGTLQLLAPVLIAPNDPECVPHLGRRPSPCSLQAIAVGRGAPQR